MTEFLSMIRLCSVIAGAGENSIFKDLAERGYLDSMRKMTAKTKAEELSRKGFKLEPEQERLVDGFLASLGRLGVRILGTGDGDEDGDEDGEEEGGMGSGLDLGLGLSLVEEEQERGRELQMRILEGLEDAAKTTKVSPAEGQCFSRPPCPPSLPPLYLSVLCESRQAVKLTDHRHCSVPRIDKPLLTPD